MDKFSCECGATINKKQLSIHKKTKKHLNFMNKKTLDLTQEPEEPEEPEEIEEQSEEEQSEQETEEQEEELVVNDVQQKKDIKELRREHLNRIRAKAHEAIKQKKIQKIQAKIDKELELETKAKMYDDLMEKQKRDKEEAILREKENKEKEMKKKLTDFDRLLEENLRLKARYNKEINLQQYAQSALLDDIKQQRLKFLSQQLGLNI